MFLSFCNRGIRVGSVGLIVALFVCFRADPLPALAQDAPPGVVERSVVRSVQFVGNARFKDAALSKDVEIEVGSALDVFAVRQGREAILAKYRDAGYGHVTVTYDEPALARGEVIYTIEEGPRVRIRRIVFEGRQSLSQSELKKRIDSKTALLIFRQGVLDLDRVQSDVAHLERYYRDEGFLDARVSYRVDTGEKPGDLVLVFTIVEGTRYRIEEVRFEGNQTFSREELLLLIGSAVGKTVKLPKVEADRLAIQKRYGEIGYIYVVTRAVRVFSETPGLVIVTFKVEEGDQYRVGRVRVRGNARTKDKVVRRALDLYPPDDLFNLTATRLAEDRLRQTKIFSSARVRPIGDEPGVRDVQMDVVETDSPGGMIFGLGVTSNAGLIGTIGLTIENFDLFDHPRSFGEFIRGQAFHGGGQKLRIEAQPGTQLTRFRLDFSEPYFLDRPLRFGTGVYLFSRGRDGYDERRVGGSVSLGKRFEQGPLRRWSGEIALRGETVSAGNLDLLAARTIRDAEGTSALTSLKFSLVLDRTNNRFLPTSGDRIRLGYEQTGVFGGDFSYGKISAGYAWHRTTSTDLLDRKSVVSLRARTGVIVGDAPVYEHLYAGGIGSLRGFQFRGVGPREGLEDNAVGGNFMLLLSAEYAFPLVGELVRGVVFSDMGTVESGVTIRDWRSSVGIGLRLQLEFLGPVPIEFDLAVPVTTGPDDDEQIFSFFIGTGFF